MKRFLIAAAFLFAASAAEAQTIGGTAQISVTNSSANVQLPVATKTYPALLMVPAQGATVTMTSIFCPTSTCTALVTGPVIPPNGICYPQMAASFTYVGAIATGAGPTVLYLTQLTQCPGGF